MINFKELRPVANNKYSFVGIEKRQSETVLCLPRGFDTEIFNTYDDKRDVFFLLYKVLREFKRICYSKGYISDRDGVLKSQGSTQKICIPDETDEENIFYSKLDNIGTILDAYDELKIISLAYRLGVTEKIDYSKIHRLLHRGVYQNNGGVYIDTMTLPRQQVHYQSTDIVSMYCYILWEIKQQLDEEVIPELQALAEDFKHKYIGSEYSLFQEDYWTITVDILKDTLEVITHQTPLKDDDFWEFHDVIEIFLYGELSEQDEGEVWGIDNFHSVWESMCLTFLVKNFEPEFILFLDKTFLSYDTILLADTESKAINLTNTFIINNKKLVPDAVALYNIFFTKREITNLHLYAINTYKDDYSYRATFYCDSPYFKKYNDRQILDRRKEIFVLTDLKIVHHKQLRDTIHTFKELEKYYAIKEKKLLINSQLPSNFYSYWTIELDKLDDESIFALMRQLNHIFYVAIKNGAYNAESFNIFLTEIDKNFDSRYERYQPIRDSLFRTASLEFISKSFENFLKVANCPYFIIIDIKYLELEYFKNPENYRDIKDRSIRKQFVYEYLLQEYIGNEIKKEMEIQSRFWIPYYSNNDTMIKKDHTLAGYIFLNTVNFQSISKYYLL
ncbi:hypothetical protein LC608_33435 [Nostoc sp. XA010]|uniref:hypothetical protein n=1 Tax=Nostoc sp. XA010 TaxID=2780407 RepID=UPI001E44E3D6|nr:hypothetical protein [Nostoc sp. XA010]MCC5661764.1 hypothetical protein [Nostoc sp. XA010]